MRILVVDDEQDMCEILQYNLETEGYEVSTANSAEEALSMIYGEGLDYSAQTLPSLILLDVMMDEMSGFQMARVLKEREATCNIPIIFITALGQENDIVKGLNIGADDYIPKPLSMNELKARVKAVLRRSAPTGRPAVNNEMEASVIAYKDMRIDIESKTVAIDGEKVQLTRLEFELLRLLLEHPNRVFSREELLTHCWPNDAYVLDRTVDVNITRLRKKIGRHGQQIKTRIGYGYVFEW